MCLKEVQLFLLKTDTARDLEWEITISGSFQDFCVHHLCHVSNEKRKKHDDKAKNYVFVGVSET